MIKLAIVTCISVVIIKLFVQLSTLTAGVLVCSKLMTWFDNIVLPSGQKQI